MARIAQDTIGTTALEVFIPAPGQNPDDPGDTARQDFLRQAQELLDAGLDISVYSRDSYPSAFTDCEPVADQLAISGDEVLPILLVEGLIKVSYMYPTAEQMRRFSHSSEVKQSKANAAAAACGTGSAGTPATAPEPAGFAAVLAGVTPRPAGGPDIGNRRNLIGGDLRQGIPGDREPLLVSRPTCGCGGCECGN